ncbi:MAG: aryldialkylphosphatase [Naasia sp.]|uniref:phosphotriesterase family protein n=1 Tax=Naasia sp. TaxID=2546198 RepID=UPI00262DDF45|nr:aryldialkylphosphatase [Naasia sp.]MCU1571556.1 aryldialkylphosphatase [Naasia sp.]
MNVRTVLGDVAPDELGRVDYHEHLFQVTPLLPGDELDDEAASRGEAAVLKASGFDAMVDATPIGLGRDPAGAVRISAATGLAVVATTGAHREAHYAPSHWLRSLGAEERANLFVRDLLEGMPERDAPGSTTPLTGARAGLLKAGIGYWSISDFERTTLEGVALASLSTGAPIMVHLEFCTAAHEVLDLLTASGIPETRVVLAHADRDPDAALHLELAARGAWLGYDGMARPRTRSDAELVALTEAVVAGGGAGSILLGGDVARRTRYLSYGGMPGLGYLATRYLPRLRAALGPLVDDFTGANPQRFLAWAAPAS